MPVSMYWPILLVVLSNTFYNICAKATPQDVNPFASLSVTYLVGAAASLAVYFLTTGSPALLAEYGKLNWSSFVLGLAIVGLESGFIYMFRAGWPISVGQVVTSILLSVVLVFVGYLFYHEAITVNKIAGILICMAGLYLLNK